MYGVKLRRTPNGTNCTPWSPASVLPPTTGTGNEPPAVKLDGWPFMVTRVVSVSDRAYCMVRRALMAKGTLPASKMADRLPIAPPESTLLPTPEPELNEPVPPAPVVPSPVDPVPLPKLDEMIGPVLLAKTVTPWLFRTLKFMPMLRAAARFTSATTTRSATCCSPATSRRLMTFGPPADWKLSAVGGPTPVVGSMPGVWSGSWPAVPPAFAALGPPPVAPMFARRICSTCWPWM